MCYMTKVRKDGKGRRLYKGECYIKSRGHYRYSYTDVFGNRKYIYSRDLMELREAEKKLQIDKFDKLDVYLLEKSDINYVFDRFIATRTDLKGTTKSGYLYTYDHYVRKGFGKKKIADVHYTDILVFYKGLLETGLSIATVENVNGVIFPTFQLALRDNVIRSNPAQGVLAELKRTTKAASGIRHALTLEQEREFLKYVDRPEYLRWKPLFTVMFGTGCRIGEIIGLRWVDVDFKENLISINHNVSYYPMSDKDFHCGYEVTTPKTEAGIRYIPMLDKVREAFLLEKKNQEEFGYHPVMEIDGMSGFIFCNKVGNLHKISGINKQIKRIVDKHNHFEVIKARREGRDPLLIPRFSCHITRHSFCSRLCENETNIKVIQSVMGHRDIQTTMDIYAEVSEQKKKDVFKELNEDDVI